MPHRSQTSPEHPRSHKTSLSWLDERGTLQNGYAAVGNDSSMADLTKYEQMAEELDESSEEGKTVVVEDDRPNLQRLTSDIVMAKTNWGSLTIAFIILLLVGIQFSVYMSSMWPYLQQIDKSADQTFFGWIIAAYSIGQLIASPLYGFWSNKLKTTRPPVMLGILVNIAANLLYCFVESFEDNRKWILLIARFFTGFGGGIAGVLRAYVAEASNPKDRMRAMSIATGAMSIGFVLGPAVQAIFTSLSYPGFQSGPFHLNQYTAPGWVVVIIGILMQIFMIVFFKTDYVGVYNAGKHHDKYKVLPKFDKLAASVCIWCWFAMLFGFVIGEAIGAPFTMAMLDWTADEAVLYNGIIYACSGAVSFIVYVVLGNVIKDRANKRISIIVGLGLLFCFYVTSFPWDFNYGKLNYQIVEIEAGRNVTNEMTLLWTGTTSLLTGTTESVLNFTKSVEATGCSNTFEWCRYTPKINLAQYIGAYCFSSIGFPTANVMISTTFSLIVGPRRQTLYDFLFPTNIVTSKRSGIMQGLFIMAGSAARTVGPIFVTYLFTYFGPRVTWGVTGGIIGFTVVVVAVAYKRLVPLEIKPKTTFRYKHGYVTPM